MNLTKRFYRLDEVAALLALSRRTIYRMISDGRLQALNGAAAPGAFPRRLWPRRRK